MGILLKFFHIIYYDENHRTTRRFFMDEQNNKVLMLAVALDTDKNVYSVDIPKGSTINEVAFNMAVVIRCMVKDGVVKDAKEMTYNNKLDCWECNLIKIVHLRK